MNFDRQKRFLLGQLALLAPLPLPFNEIIGWPSLILFWIAVGVFLLRVQRGDVEPLPNWVMNVLGAAYLPILFFDFSVFWQGRLLRPLVHLAMFTLVVKLFGIRRERDKWHVFLLIFFVFLASMGTSVHPLMVLYLMTFLVMGVRLLAKFASFHVLSSYGVGRPDRIGVPLRGFLIGAALGTALLAIPLFTLLPRLGRPYVTIPGVGGGRLSPGAAFLDQITLDSIGRVRTSRAVVMRLRYESPPPVGHEMRFKGGTFRDFRGKTWQRGRPDRIQPLFQRGGHFRMAPGPLDTWIEIWLRLMAGDSLVLPVDVRAIEFKAIGLAMDDSGVVSPMNYPPGTLKYRAAIEEGSPRSLPYAVPASSSYRAGEPSLIPERIAELALEVAGTGPAAEQAGRIESHLIQNYDYTLDLLGFDSDSPVEDFLFRNRRGHCEYFASSMVLMLRSLGIPARLATGYLGAEFNPFEGYYIVRQSNAHAWVEAYLPEEGWRLFDPTPPDGRPVTESAGLKLLAEQAWDFVVFRWDRYVLTFGFGDQVSLFGRLQTLWQSVWDKLRSRDEPGSRTTEPEVEEEPSVDAGDQEKTSRRLGPTGFEWVPFLGAALAILWWLWRRRPEFTATRAYRRLRGRVAERDKEPLADSVPPLGLARHVRLRHPSASRPAERLVELYLRESFGGERLSVEERGELKEALRDAFRSLRKTA